MSILSLALWGCTAAVDDSAEPVDSGTDTGEVALQADVLVIGSGPAGLAAAWEAREAGAVVVVLELDERAGGAGWYAGNFFGVDTSWQAILGIEDSVEDAARDWASFTGGDGDDPWVQTLLERSAETLEWLVYEFGLEVTDVIPDPSAGQAPRVHLVGSEESPGAISPLVETLEDVIWTETRADRLLVDGDRVVGAEATDLKTGEAFEIFSGATVVATGGFARDLDAVEADRADLAGLEFVVEAAWTSTGAGRELLTGVDVASQNEGHFGVYVHSAADFREGFEGEAIWIPQMARSLIVTSEGHRFTNEDETRSFHLSYRLSEVPERRLLALYPVDVLTSASLALPAYNWEDAGEPEYLSVDVVVEGGGALSFDTPAALAGELDMDPDVLQATFELYEQHVADGVDGQFHKSPEYLVSFGEDPIILFELLPGAAKAFGGAELDPAARVLDIDGNVIPGLYAAGEVAGMLGTAAVGEGFSGSITACYLTGRIAGQEAAAESLAR